MLTIHYREAGIDDKPIVYELMQELIKELSSDSSVKEFLESWKPISTSHYHVMTSSLF